MRAPSSAGRGTSRVLTGLAAGAVLAAVVVAVGLPSAESAEATAPAPVIAPTTVVAAPVVGTPPAPTSAATPTATPSPVATPTSRKPRATTTPTKRAGSCAEAAMKRGRFDPSCDEYQGYLDPGTAAGREPTSGETQFEYGCEQGWIPRSECG